MGRSFSRARLIILSQLCSAALMLLVSASQGLVVNSANLSSLLEMTEKCDEPKPLGNGWREVEGHMVGKNMHWHCQAGFLLVPPQTKVSRCNESLEWEPEPPTCREYFCGDPGVPYNGKRKGDKLSLGAVLSFSCNDGYQLDGYMERMCLANGSWSHSMPTCKKVGMPECKVPPAMANGYRLINSNSHLSVGRRVVWECRPGHLLVGQTESECQPDLTWKPSPPYCAEVFCGDPGIPQNGLRDVQGKGFALGSVLHFTCKAGYFLVGYMDRTCLPNLTWSNEQPVCWPVLSALGQNSIARCHTPRLLLNGSREVTGSTVGSIVRWHCDAGFSLMPFEATSSTCNEKLLWEPAPPRCQEILCGHPGVLRNGKHKGALFSLGAVVTFTCDAGYKLIGYMERICLANGSWSHSQPTCEKEECAVPQVLTNGLRLIRSDGSLTPGRRVTWECCPGHLLVGGMQSECQPDLTWKPTPPSCYAVFCGDPGYPTNGKREGDSLALGSVLRFKCDEGYWLVGYMERTCLDNGTWSNTQPCCVPVSDFLLPKERCAQPKVLMNGSRTIDHLGVGGRVKWRCNNGFHIVGNVESRCGSDLQWSLPPPICRARTLLR